MMEPVYNKTNKAHKCNLKQNDDINRQNKLRWYQKYIVICPDNPLCVSYFRSDISVKAEQTRQLKLRGFVIHPFSKFRALYDIYLIFLYGYVLVTKPMDAGFIKYEDCSEVNLYVYLSSITDLLCCVDVTLNFLTGYEDKRLQMIELRKNKIAREYVLGLFFICDVLSSIPKCLMYYVAVSFMNWGGRLAAGGITSILGLFKAVRIISFVKCIWKAADYFRITSKGMIFLICTISGSLMVIHWLSCMQFAIPRLFRINFSPTLQNTSWFYSLDLYDGTLYTEQSLLIRYNHCFFKSSAYILGIRLECYNIDLPEEYVLAVISFFIGRILIGFIWIILVVAILKSRVMDIKFAEVINQLQEYMRQQHVPTNLRSRIVQHFDFKYQNKYFQEELITSLLSEALRKEAVMHTCKALIDNVSLFSDLNHIEVSKVVQYLVPEIFLPNDTIIHAGTHGDAMYFLASGTVGVYTRSGKEICHLHDGAYFGEVALVIKGQLRSITIIALETSQVYKLVKKDLQRCLLNHKTIMLKILNSAEERLKETTRLEEQYKEQLLEQTLREVTPGLEKKSSKTSI